MKKCPKLLIEGKAYLTIGDLLEFTHQVSYITEFFLVGMEPQDYFCLKWVDIPKTASINGYNCKYDIL